MFVLCFRLFILSLGQGFKQVPRLLKCHYLMNRLKGSRFCFSESKNNLPWTGWSHISVSVYVCVWWGGRMVGIKSVIKWEDFSAESC